jgi:hypothetical protein
MEQSDRQIYPKGLTENGCYYEYTKAADPIGSGAIPKIPFADFGSELHETGGTRIIPLDISSELGCEGPATSPALCANFVRILASEALSTKLTQHRNSFMSCMAVDELNLMAQKYHGKQGIL